jgi:acetyl/propionyl-CoA carboxylase alpha subunit
MFKKILITNRGVIATRIIRTCHDMGIEAVALYTATDRGSLHVRLADECVQLDSPTDLFDSDLLIDIARRKGADAIHPGYGFLAEEAGFIRACAAAGIAFIGPSAAVVEPLRNKISAQDKARAAGFATPQHSAAAFGPADFAALSDAAAAIGYPIIIKSCSGGRGRGERLALSPRYLPEAVRQAQAVSQAVYGNRQVYLEKAILPAYQVGVQIMADKHGRLIHLGEREGSILQTGFKIVEESPATCLTGEQRLNLWQTALEIARLFNYDSLGTVEFLVDKDGNFFFSEIKARIQVDHQLTEMRARLDLVREQIRLAAGEDLTLEQEDILLDGWSMLCRVRANDPWHQHMTSPGRLTRVHLPGGPEVRVDTYVYCNCEVPAEYDPLLANLSTWAPDRELCRRRMDRALQDFSLVGTASNLPLLQEIIAAPQFVNGTYTTDFMVQLGEPGPAHAPDEHLADLAAATALLYLQRNQLFNPQPSPRLAGGWHDSSRRLPQ